MDVTKNQESKESTPPSVLGRVINVLSYPVAAISGYFTFDTQVRSVFYGNFAKLKKFSDLQAPVKEKIDQILEKKALDNTVHVSNEIRAVQDDYREAVNSRIGKWGYKGIGDLWKNLHHNQKIRVGAEALTVTGITLGALILISENIDRLTQVFKTKHDSDDQSMSR